MLTYREHILNTFRGCPGLLLEMNKNKNGKEVECDPNEDAARLLLDLSSPSAQSIILSSRERISRRMISLLYKRHFLSGEKDIVNQM